jgi:hypothetical protein
VNDSTHRQHTRSRPGAARIPREPAAEPSCSTTLHAGLVDQPDLGRRSARRRAAVAWQHHETCNRRHAELSDRGQVRGLDRVREAVPSSSTADVVREDRRSIDRTLRGCAVAAAGKFIEHSAVVLGRGLVHLRRRHRSGRGRSEPNDLQTMR